MLLVRDWMTGNQTLSPEASVADGTDLPRERR